MGPHLDLKSDFMLNFILNPFPPQAVVTKPKPGFKSFYAVFCNLDSLQYSRDEYRAMRCDGIKSRSGLVTVFSPLQLLRFQNGVTGAQRRHMVKLLSRVSVNFRKHTKNVNYEVAKGKTYLGSHIAPYPIPASFGNLSKIHRSKTFEYLAKISYAELKGYKNIVWKRFIQK